MSEFICVTLGKYIFTSELLVTLYVIECTVKYTVVNCVLVLSIWLMLQALYRRGILLGEFK